MKKKVLLINPRKGQIPPLGLLYIASYLRRAGHDVKVIEFFDDNYLEDANRKLWGEFYAYDPDIIGMGVISWNRGVAKSIIEKIRETTSGKLVICGHKDPSFNPGKYMEYGADFAVIGEGEETMVELIKAINDGTAPEDVDGIAFRKDGRLIITKSRRLPDLKSLIHPAFDLINYNGYCRMGINTVPGHFYRMGFMIATRGCPFKCRFCSDPLQRGSYRKRGLDDIIAEIKWQRDTWNVEGIVFKDYLFYHNEKEIIEFCNRVMHEGIRMKYYAQVRPDLTGSEDVLTLMKKAGFIQLGLGVESGSQRMLDSMKKGTQLEDIRRSITLMNKVGIDSFAYLIVGLPDERKEDLILTHEFVKELKPTFTGVAFFTPMPGTDYYDRLDEKKKEDPVHNFLEFQQSFASEVSYEDVVHYRSLLERSGTKNKYLNLLQYPKFIKWLLGFMLFHSDVILKGIAVQKRKKLFNSYFDAVIVSIQNYCISH